MLSPREHYYVYNACDELRQAINSGDRDGYRVACEEAHSLLRRVLGPGPWECLAGTTWDEATEVANHA